MSGCAQPWPASQWPLGLMHAPGGYAGAVHMRGAQHPHVPIRRRQLDRIEAVVVDGRPVARTGLCSRRTSDVAESRRPPGPPKCRRAALLCAVEEAHHDASRTRRAARAVVQAVQRRRGGPSGAGPSPSRAVPKGRMSMVSPLRPRTLPRTPVLVSSFEIRAPVRAVWPEATTAPVPTGWRRRG